MFTRRSLNALVFFLLAVSPVSQLYGQTSTPLPQAHSHNDYYQTKPLEDALALGFCSVEADVFLKDGQLLVGHYEYELRPERSLQAMYLDPLKSRVDANNGSVYRDGPLFTLLVDIKTDGEAVYKELDALLAGYKPMLCRLQAGEVVPGAVQIVISGDRPIATIASAADRFVFVDGRLGDLDSDKPASLIPLISDRWTSHFRWQGNSPMPDDQRRKLHSIVEKAHSAGRRVRFWATPEKELLWQELRAAGVDHINTDRLEKLADYLRDR